MKTPMSTTLRAAGLLAAVLASGAVATTSPSLAAGGEPVHIDRQDWSFAGFFGQFDRPQLRRGFQVYKDVCSSCHGLDRVYFRNLAEPGGPMFDEAAVKALATDWPNQVTDGPNDEGAMFERPALLSDPILGPYKNEKQARASQNGALPPDLSNIIKARTIESHDAWYVQVFKMGRDILTGYQEAGADYVFALLTGYAEPPAGFELSEGMNYNKAFPGHQIAMMQPIPAEGAVEYQENAGAKSSLEQNARDVTAFLAWASDPSLEARKRIGWQVMLYLLITTVLLFIAKRRIWARVEH